MIDDSVLFHSRTYDPQKAHEYYLRTRKLKGRTPAASKVPAARDAGGSAVATGGKPNRSKTKSRQEQLREQKAHLEARLEHLRNVLEELVKAAKKRSGGDPNKKDDSKDKAPETQKDKADRNKAAKDRKPLTAKQKADKAKKAKEDYEKEHPNSLSQDVDILKEQVKDIQSKIATALKNAQEAQARRNKAGKTDPRSGSKNDHRSGPQGR